MPVHNLKQEYPMTPAIRMLKAAKAEYTPMLYVFEERGGTSHLAHELGIDEHLTVKTLIMETDAAKPLVILMHGDCSVSTKELARVVGVKSIRPCEPARADHFSGYHVGGTTPFAPRRQMPIYVEESILTLEKIYINGGYRGFVLEMSPQVLVDLLHPVPVHVALQS